MIFMTLLGCLLASSSSVFCSTSQVATTVSVRAGNCVGVTPLTLNALPCFLHFLLFVAAAQYLSQRCTSRHDKEKVGCLFLAANHFFDQGCGAKEEAGIMEGTAELNLIGYT
jgi:hypothetical protein